MVSCEDRPLLYINVYPSVILSLIFLQISRLREEVKLLTRIVNTLIIQFGLNSRKLPRAL
jgi:uncharacterized membrane protein YfhO